MLIKKSSFQREKRSINPSARRDTASFPASPGSRCCSCAHFSILHGCSREASFHIYLERSNFSQILPASPQKISSPFDSGCPYWCSFRKGGFIKCSLPASIIAQKCRGGSKVCEKAIVSPSWGSSPHGDTLAFCLLEVSETPTGWGPGAFPFPPADPPWPHRSRSRLFMTASTPAADLRTREQCHMEHLV